ncbi:major capsid family protein [Acidiphilium sp.]|uniref:major capsid family protein n=1 Tax=Acidiphilium sp. TaxID=527 RepID=UPI002C952284|nr:major capsid family protein [Acidiphilium sp.]HQT62176.1 DUF2184 domain-containing protein [Acidiphilium sp.]
MGNYFPAQAKITPSFTEPDLIVTYAQASGWMRALAGGKPKVKIGNDDLFVYVNGLDLRNPVSIAQTAGNFLPSASLTGTFYSTPTYLLRTRVEYGHHDTSAAARYAVSLPTALDTASRQGHFQQARVMGLYGYNASNGEGLLNASGATSVTLPADSYGNTTVSTYDNGQLALWVLQQMTSLQESMFQTNAPNRIVFVGPQRIFYQMSNAQVVQLTAYQRAGAGTQTVGRMIEEIGEANGIDVEFCYDDTLIGKGTGGADMVIMTIPELVVPDIPGLNTNVFGEMSPATKEVNVMYADMAAPMKISTPIPEGITEIHEWRLTSGWNPRGIGVWLLSMPH